MTLQEAGCCDRCFAESRISVGPNLSTTYDLQSDTDAMKNGAEATKFLFNKKSDCVARRTKPLIVN